MSYQFDRLKILVVDDNVHMRKLVTTILQAFGVIQIYEADSGERAWQLLREANPDICVVDWVMEGMSGLDFTTKVRSDPAAPNPDKGNKKEEEPPRREYKGNGSVLP